jgi:hypothetical protein
LSSAARRASVDAVLAKPPPSNASSSRDWLQFGYIRPFWALISALGERKTKAPQL